MEDTEQQEQSRRTTGRARKQVTRFGYEPENYEDVEIESESDDSDYYSSSDDDYQGEHYDPEDYDSPSMNLSLMDVLQVPAFLEALTAPDALNPITLVSENMANLSIALCARKEDLSRAWYYAAVGVAGQAVAINQPADSYINTVRFMKAHYDTSATDLMSGAKAAEDYGLKWKDLKELDDGRGGRRGQSKYRKIDILRIAQQKYKSEAGMKAHFERKNKKKKNKHNRNVRVTVEEVEAEKVARRAALEARFAQEGLEINENNYTVGRYLNFLSPEYWTLDRVVSNVRTNLRQAEVSALITQLATELDVVASDIRHECLYLPAAEAYYGGGGTIEQATTAITNRIHRVKRERDLKQRVRQMNPVELSTTEKRGWEVVMEGPLSKSYIEHGGDFDTVFEKITRDVERQQEQRAAALLKGIQAKKKQRVGN